MKIFFQQLMFRIKNLMMHIFRYPYTVTISIIVFFMLLFGLVTQTGIGFRSEAKRLRVNFEKSDSIRALIVEKNSNINICTQALANQYRYINTYKEQHLDVAEKFETFYYAFVLILSIATVVATLLIVLIARNGWQNQPLSIKAAFLGFFFTASLIGVLMNTFNNAENANKNISKYFYFTNLQTNIYDALAIDSVLDIHCKDSTLKRVFWDNNKNMKENMNLFLDIKADKIPPAPDINKSIGGH